MSATNETQPIHQRSDEGSIPVFTKDSFSNKPLIKSSLLARNVPSTSSDSFIEPTLESDSFSTEKLSPLAQMYFAAEGRATALQRQVETLQAQANLNAEQATEACIRAERSEKRASLLQRENNNLRQQVKDQQDAIDKARKGLDDVLEQLNRLKMSSARGAGRVDANWSVLGLDPKIAFIGLTREQRQAVLDSAYRTRSKFYHPDNGGDEKQMKIINAAYASLKNDI